MFELKNGVLHQDGKPIIAMGQSYYPSFHKAKYPLPEHMDRIGLDKFEEAVFSDDLMNRREEILAAPIKERP